MSTRSFAMICLPAILALTSPARADESSGLRASARVGYGLPVGKLADESGADFDRYFKGALPLWIDVGYRFDRSFFVGGYFQYGVAFIANDLKNEFRSLAAENGATAKDFGGSDVRLGVEATYKFLPDLTFAPWVGLGVGYEWANSHFTVTNGSGSADASLGARGLDFMVQLGGDYRLSPHFAVGPFMAFTFGRFSTTTYDVSSGAASQSGSQDIDDEAWHEWLQFGLKGTFDL